MTVPEEAWVVFGNGALVEKTKSEGGFKHSFEQSPPISTYLYGMDAGSFSIIDNDNKEFKVPIRIGIRKTKIKFIDPREFFRILEAAILFYEDFF